MDPNPVLGGVIVGVRVQPQALEQLMREGDPQELVARRRVLRVGRVAAGALCDDGRRVARGGRGGRAG